MARALLAQVELSQVKAKDFDLANQRAEILAVETSGLQVALNQPQLGQKFMAVAVDRPPTGVIGMVSKGVALVQTLAAIEGVFESLLNVGELEAVGLLAVANSQLVVDIGHLDLVLLEGLKQLGQHLAPVQRQAEQLD